MRNALSLLRLLTSRRARNAFRNKSFMAAPPKYADLCGASFDRSVIATVAFNRPDILEWQIFLIRKYLAEQDSYIVFDNSSRRESRDANQALCRREAVPYVSLPQISFRESFSHAAALNWISQNFIAPRKPQFFGFVDHDIFPLAPFSIAERLADSKVYGLRYNQKEAWYLWAGFCFFSGVPIGGLNFSPVSNSSYGYLDTGGANWDSLYRHLSADQTSFAKAERETTTAKGRYFEEIDGWLHAGNASGWNDKTWPKDRRALLEARLRGVGGDNQPTAVLGGI